MEKIAVFGLGLMGGSLAAAFKKFLPELQVYGYDFDETADRALDLKFIDFKLEDFNELPDDLDIAFLAAPISVNLDLLKTLTAIKTWKHLLITDLGSTKKSVISTAESLAGPRWSFLGGHPMVGSEKTGIDAATPFLFENAVYILSESSERKVPDDSMSLFIRILYKIGARVIKIPAEFHDKIVAHISHLPHLLAVSLVDFIGKQEKSDLFFQLAGGGFRDLTRVAGSSVNLWKDILGQNKENISLVLEEFAKHLLSIKDKLNDNSVESVLRSANKKRTQIPSDTRGFINPLVDIRVEITDTPGVLSDVTSILASEGVDIKDISILKIRENLGGVLQLSFDRSKTASKALSLLAARGYKVFD